MRSDDEHGSPPARPGAGHSATLEAALRESELRYRVLYDENPSMYFTVDPAGTVLSVNPFGAEQLGYAAADLVGQPVLQVFHPEDREPVREQLQRCIDAPGRSLAWEFRKVHRDGRVLWVREVARAVADRDGGTIVLIVCEDITARKEMEQALRRARDEMELRVVERTAELERQRRFLRQIIDVDPNFIFARDGEGRFTLVNQAVAEALGATVEQLIGRCDPRHAAAPAADTLCERFIAEEPFTDATGRVRWFQTVERPLCDERGAVTQVLGSATDITARREAETKLRHSEARLRRSQQELQHLAGRLLTAQEDERRRLAREMHDDLTQRLVGLSMQAARLEQLRPPNCAETSALIREIRAALSQLAADIHALSRRLHPSVLSDLGLVAALELECESSADRGKLHVAFEHHAVPPDIDKDTAVCLYRIAQEALRNVAKHARTDTARVRLIGLDDGSLQLTVEDRGVGFDTTQVRSAGIGLASMGERARLIQADFAVESRAGAGATVRVRAPAARGTAPG